MKKLLFFISLGLAVFIFYNFISSLYHLWQKQDILTKAEEQLFAEKRTNQVLKKELHLVKEQQFVEEQARDKLLLQRAGESSIVIPTTVLPSQPPPNTLHLNEKTPLEQWWYLFRKKRD